MADVKLGSGEGRLFAVEIRSDATDTGAVAHVPGPTPGQPWQRIEIPRHAIVNQRAVFRTVLEVPAGVDRDSFEVAFSTRNSQGAEMPAQSFGQNFKPFQLVAASCYDPRELRPLPNSRYASHDCARPRAPIAKQELGDIRSATAPADAAVLFDGTSLAHWQKAESAGEPPEWQIVDGAVRINGSTSMETRAMFGPCELYLEYRIPDWVEGVGQHRGNSGVMFVSKGNTYEVQVLDSYANPTYADGEAGALYGQFPPDQNAARPAGMWQSLRIRFSGPLYADDGSVKPARLSVWHNDIRVHHDREAFGPTAWKKHVTYAEAGPHGPDMQIRLQNHGDAVLDFRNIWIRRCA